jgi:predicted NAD-dependent protein-ADP-ribosyltransferase YbiA (DUF1768 family)
MALKRKRCQAVVDPVKSATETFSSKKKILGELSNFYNTTVIVDHGSVGGGVREYLSGEAAFHGSKFRSAAMAHQSGSARGAELRAHGRKFESDGGFEDLSAADLKSKGGKTKKNGFELDERERAAWSAKCIDVQREICQFKFDNDEAVRACLISSGQKILVHSAYRTGLAKIRECFWEGKAVLKEDGITVEVLGRNELGKIWMEIRDRMNQNID